MSKEKRPSDDSRSEEPEPDLVSAFLEGAGDFMNRARDRVVRREIEKKPPESPNIVFETNVRDLQHAIRCGCLHMSNMSQISKPADSKELSGTDTTVQYVKRENRRSDTTEVLRQAEYTTMISYNPDSKALYFQCVDQYARAHAVLDQGSTTLTGPGIISMCGIKDMDNFLSQKKAWVKRNSRKGKRDSIRENNSRNEQAVDTPVFLKVLSNQMDSAACTDDTLEHLQNGSAHGLIFQNAQDLNAFAEWYNNKIASNSRQRANANMSFRFPTLVLRGEPAQIHKMIRSGSAKNAHAFFFDRPLTPEQANELRDARAEMMKLTKEGEDVFNPFNRTMEDDIHNLKVGVMNVQGAGRLEAAMIALASRNIPQLNVHLRLMQTREQIERWNPDALVMGGGWHYIQHAMQEHEATGINRLLGEIIKRNQVHLLGSCAGAILMRQPDTINNKSVDCVPASAMGILPYHVVNNALSGLHETEFLTHGGSAEEWTRIPRALYVSAPELILDENHEGVETIARSIGKTFGVLRSTENHTDAVHAATALHNILPYVFWLHEIHENIEFGRIRSHHRAVEKNVRD